MQQDIDILIENMKVINKQMIEYNKDKNDIRLEALIESYQKILDSIQPIDKTSKRKSINQDPLFGLNYII